MLQNLGNGPEPCKQAILSDTPISSPSEASDVSSPCSLCYNVTRGPDQNNQPKLVQDSQFQKLDEIREFSSVRFLFLYMLLNLETGGEFVMQQLMTNTSQAINYAEVKAEE